jgi:hypothetical protein
VEVEVVAYPAITFQARDIYGAVDSSATYYVYQRGTTTQVNCYNNSDGSGGAITQPISVGADGVGHVFVERDSRKIDIAYTIDGTSFTQEVEAVPGDPSAGWVTLTLLNSWVNTGSPYASASYRIMENGLVILRGTIQSGTSGVVANLPAGARPVVRVMYNVYTWLGECRCDVLAGGDISLQGYSSTLVDLGGVAFVQEQ